MATKKTAEVLEEEKVVEQSEIQAQESSEKKPEKAKRARKPKVVEDEYRDLRAILKGARQKMTILSGMLERVEYADNYSNPDKDIRAIVFYNGFRVVIPASFMGLNVPENLPSQERASMYKKYLNAMISADVDFVILSVDEKENLAIGSRKIAMGIKRKQNFENLYRNTGMSYISYCIAKKRPVDAKVMSVSGSLVRVEVCGIESRVFAKDASWRYTTKLNEMFYPGDTVKVIVKSFEKSETGEWSIEVSIREATPNKLTELASTFKINSVCVGTVSGVTEKGYYIDVGDIKTGIPGFCSLVHGTDIPQVGDKVICQIVNIDLEKGFAIVKITRIVRRANQNRF